MTKLFDCEGEIDVVWDLGKRDIIIFNNPKDDSGKESSAVMFFKRGFLSERFPLKTKVKITVETLDKTDENK